MRLPLDKDSSTVNMDTSEQPPHASTCILHACRLLRNHCRGFQVEGTSSQILRLLASYFFVQSKSYQVCFLRCQDHFHDSILLAFTQTGFNAMFGHQFAKPLSSPTSHLCSSYQSSSSSWKPIRDQWPICTLISLHSSLHLYWCVVHI